MTNENAHNNGLIIGMTMGLTVAEQIINNNGGCDGCSSVLCWDYNKSPITVGQNETEIALIKNVEFTRSTEARGMFLVSFTANSAADVIVRIYVNNSQGKAQTLYTPYIKHVGRGNNEIGIPHSYLMLKAGGHDFSVTMQCTSGSVLIRTRAVKYTIDAWFMGSPGTPLPYDIRDISLQQSSNTIEPMNIYAITITKEGHPLILNARYRQGYISDESAFSTVHLYNDIVAKEAAMEFNGLFQLIGDVSKHTLITDSKPWIFWITPDDELFGQYGDEPHTRVQLATQALFLSVVRGWNQREFPDHDTGLIVAYIKHNGVVAYRTRMNTPTLPGVWTPEEILDEAGDGNSFVHVHRLNDYRIGFAVTGCDKLFISRRFLVGQGVKPEHNSIRLESASNFGMIPIDAEPLELYAEFIDNYNIIISGNYRFGLRSLRNPHHFNLTVDQGGVRTITDLKIVDGKLHLTFANPVSSFADMVVTASQWTFLQYIVDGSLPYWPAVPITIPGSPLRATEHNRIRIRPEVSFEHIDIKYPLHSQYPEHNTIRIRPDVSFEHEIVVHPEYKTHIQYPEHNTIRVRAGEIRFGHTPIGVDPL